MNKNDYAPPGQHCPYCGKRLPSLERQLAFLRALFLMAMGGLLGVLLQPVLS